MNRLLPPALLAMALAGPTASAALVHFVNPAPGQPGHYDWHAPVGGARFLDITVPASEQGNQENGTSIGQGISGYPTGGTFSVMLGAGAGPGALFVSAFAVESETEPRTLALSYGDPVVGRVYESYGYFAQGSPPLTPSLFPEGERRYVGVRTDDGHHGWIEVQRTGLSLAAFSWAYETVQGAPVHAGVVPGPGALAAFALALAGLVTRRPRARVPVPPAMTRATAPVPI